MSTTHQSADSSEGPGTQPGGIARLALCSGSTKRGTKQKLDYKSFEKKYESIMEAEKGIRSKKSIAAEFNIPASTMSTWIQNADDIKKNYLSGDVAPQRKKARGAKYPEVEDALLKWFRSARNQGVPISGAVCQQKARDFAKRLGIPEVDFECSCRWSERFKARHSITFKRVCGKSKSVDSQSDAMAEWKGRLDTILKEYSPDDVFNADETGITGTPVHADEDEDDDVPLATLVSRTALGVNLTEYSTADDHLPTSAILTDDQIIDDIISTRNIDKNDSDEDEEPAPPRKKTTVKGANMACDYMRQFIEEQDISDYMLPCIALMDRFVSKVHLSRVHNRQSDMTSFLREVDVADGDRL